MGFTYKREAIVMALLGGVPASVTFVYTLLVSFAAR